jgi:hypothetical protein
MTSETTRRCRRTPLTRQHRHERPLGQHAVSDLAALGPPHEAGLTGREGREVVVVHVAPELVGRDRVELLVHARHAQGRDVERPGSRRAGRAPSRGSSGRGRSRPTADGCRLTVRPSMRSPVLDDAPAHQLLGQRPDRRLDSRGPARGTRVRAAAWIDVVASANASLRGPCFSVTGWPWPGVGADGLDPVEHVLLVVVVELEVIIVIGPRSATKALTSSRWRLMDSRIQSLDCSRPCASTSSVTLGAPSSYLTTSPRSRRPRPS